MHFVRDAANVQNKRAPRRGETFLLAGKVYRLPIAYIRDLDSVLHCAGNGRLWSDAPVTLKTVAVEP